MGVTTEQLQALRTPPDVKAAGGEQYHEHITKTILGALEKLSFKDLTSCASKSGADALDDLDPSLDTLPYLYILGHRIVAAKKAAKTAGPDVFQPGGELYNKLVMFLVSLDPVEIRYEGEKWKDLVDLLADIAEAFPKQHVVLGDMASAMLKLDPSAGTLTSRHLTFVQLCLKNEAFGQAHFILEKDIHSFAGKSTSTIDGPYPCSDHKLSSGFIDAKASSFTEALALPDILEYYLLGAMCYIGLRSWANAIYYLEHVLCTPSNNTANGVMVEAYKKWILVNLLLKGEVPSLPKGPSGQAVKLMRNTSKPYESYADAFKLANPRKLRAEMDLCTDLWVEDGNCGLVKRVFQHHRTLSVINFGKVYAAMPLSKVAKYQGLSTQQTEQYLQGLIRDGVLSAVIDAPSEPSGEAILRFKQKSANKSDARSEAELCQELMAQTKRIKLLAVHVEEADRRLSLTKEYVDHVRKARRSKEERNGAEDESLMDMSMGNAMSSDDGEEGIMTDA